jgi:predicted MFS family arabinose efflux permease
VFDRTQSERWLGFVEAAGVVPGLVVGLFAGALADRIRPKRMIIGSQIVQMALALFLAAIVAAGNESVLTMTLVVALTRVFVTFEMPSRQVFVREVVGRPALMNAIALNSGLFNASRVVGPALAGICLAKLGESACFLLNGLSYLAAIFALILIRTHDEPPEAHEHPSLRDSIMDGLRYLKRDRLVSTLFLLVVAMGVLGMGYTALAAAYAQRTIGTREGGYSSLLACGGIGATVGALYVASKAGTKRRDRMVLGGMAFFSVSLAACASLPTLCGPLGSTARIAAASTCLLFVGFGAIVFYASAQSMIQAAVPDDLRGRVMGIWMIFYSGSVPVGCLWAGEVAARTSVPMVMCVSAIFTLLISIWAAATGRLRART